MEDIEYDLVLKLLDESVRPSSQARLDDDGKPVPNLANFGAKKGTIVKLERNGEYYGIAVELLEDVLPVLTDYLMKRIVKLLQRQDYASPLDILHLTKVEQLHYLLYTWFSISVTDSNPIPKPTISYPKLDRWIKTVRHDPIYARIKVIEIGFNKDTDSSVLPEEWIDREFDSAQELHKAFDSLPSRSGKPPVTYAVIYSMIIQSNQILVDNPKASDYQHIIYLEYDDSELKTSFTRRIKKDHQHIQYGKVLIGFVLNDLLENKKQEGPRQVGVMVSRMQKAIRRGREGSKILMETIDNINKSSNYNLPEHNFLRVSASKQLAWRLFITILEDCRPYSPENCVSLFQLILLVLICQKLTEYRFRKPLLNMIKELAFMAQYNDTPEDASYWRELKPAKKIIIDPDSEYRTAIALAIHNLPMMAGDNLMLSKLYSDKREHKLFEIPERFYDLKNDILKNGYDHEPKIYRDIELATFDPHCKTWIILYYQAVTKTSMTTEQISAYIWDKSSSYNVRDTNDPPVIDKHLRAIQKHLSMEEPERFTFHHLNETELVTIPINDTAYRTTFLILFGKKWFHGGYEIIFSGTEEYPLRIKKKGGEWEYSNDPELISSFPRQTVHLDHYDPPPGYQWKKKYANVSIVNGFPEVDGRRCKFFRVGTILNPVLPKGKQLTEAWLMDAILLIMTGSEIKFETLLKLRNNQATDILNWVPGRKILKLFKIDLIRLAYTKIFNQINNIIMIGPVTRAGQKMQNSINHLFEGKIWAIFTLFCYLYPETFKPSGPLNFQLRKNTLGYSHLIFELQKILFRPVPIIKTRLPKIITPLWDHQLDSVNKITAGFRRGEYGHGDASHVGSGKTLTSLAIAAKMIEEGSPIYSGILVLLPNNKLIATWQEEIDKHTKGFDVIFQDTKTVQADRKYVIKPNTILVTTLARMRDSPVNHNWILVIIDECLAVQNKNALWTESAWIQSKMSKHLLMMSATFFRSRFDKLYYMLKMLGTGLPENKDYLDTILLESIVSQIPSITRKWNTEINHFDLGSRLRKKYREIEEKEQTLEKKYASLNSFLSQDAVVLRVAQSLAELIKRKEEEGRRCLIYARNMDEAMIWSTELDISIYPKKGKHCIVTYHEGTYGLNDLVIYDCLVMRPPAPDKLPQIKGRLDRPGQKESELYIEYFVLAETIEEGLLIRMSIASEFMHKYIMPLAQFYEISINYSNYVV
jgi:hypothetical protein